MHTSEEESLTWSDGGGVVNVVSSDGGGGSESGRTEFGGWSWDGVGGPWVSLSEPLKMAVSEN